MEMRVYETVLWEVYAHDSNQHDTYIIRDGAVVSSNVRTYVGQMLNELPHWFGAIVEQLIHHSDKANRIWPNKTDLSYGYASWQDWHIVTCIEYMDTLVGFYAIVPKLLMIAVFAMLMLRVPGFS